MPVPDPKYIAVANKDRNLTQAQVCARSGRLTCCRLTILLYCQIDAIVSANQQRLKKVAGQLLDRLLSKAEDIPGYSLSSSSI